MSDGHPDIPFPMNEPILDYAPGDPERASLEARIREMAAETVDAPMVIGGREVRSGQTFDHVSPHRHERVLAKAHAAEAGHVEDAVEAALAAKADWAATPWKDRAAIFLKAAELIAGPYRDTINAATILGQSKSVYQAEIDAACELIDFLRFNVHYADQIYREQPLHSPGATWNQLDWRPLEGFILAITPFNFTAIAGNLPTAPAMMGNTVVWKPSEKQVLSAHYTMEIFREAGVPDGVINLVHGDGKLAADVALARPELAGLHFTGSSAVLKDLFRKTASNLDTYRTYPRIVGESGGKDFIVAHPTADARTVAVALARGAFEYQGQKCSAASRAYLPKSLWNDIRDELVGIVGDITMGDVGEDLSTFMGAVIDGVAFKKHRDAIAQAKKDGLELVCGGGTDDSVGWFVEPTVLRTDDPKHDLMERELFGPILTVYVYEDDQWDETLELVDSTSAYALTGAVFARERAVLEAASQSLRNAAGNFYLNDKCTGSVVGQQPFGGARASGTNDKAGSHLNLLRWVSPRAVKENFTPPTEWTYPHQG
ncbi:MAG: L-glutamate gamma-semialdehyde dehydrogenase [Gemmatimonadales bacterium]|nr:MAG: L-glutamate gamma-semialdehyde dehydrogenase [Gemmatimonadales bacterium]